MYEFKITLNDNDYLLFNQYHLLNSPTGKKTVMLLKFFIPFICILFVVKFYIEKADFQLILIEAILMSMISIIWIGYSKKILLKSVKKYIKKIKKDGRLPYSNEAILKFDDESIYEITPNTESNTKYSLVEKIAVTENAIYIYFSSVQAYIVPVTAFSEEMEKLKFLEFINSKVKI